VAGLAVVVFSLAMLLPALHADPYTRATLHLKGDVGNGGRLFRLNCAGCHLPDGSGSAANDVPSLHGAPGHLAGIPEGRAFLTQVPGIAYSSLNDAEVSEVLNWVLLNFSKDTLPASFQPFTGQEVKALRAQRPAEIFKVRRAAIDALRAKGITLNY
jgi:mono/diheme cytochrome c family protein